MKHVFIMSLVGAAIASHLAMAAIGGDEAANANNKFGFDLFKTVQKRTAKGNKFLSPVSAYLALSMALNGATGETLAQMEQTLRISGLNRDDLNTANAALQHGILSRSRDVEISLANSLWARKGFDMKPNFVSRVGRSYSARLAVLNFALPTASVTINQWVKDATHGLIPSIVEDRLPDALKLLLVNATYFDAKWQHRFDLYATRLRDFSVTGADGKSRNVPVPTMAHMARYRHLATNDYEAIDLPFGNDGKASMVVVLPAAGMTLQEFERRSDAGGWSALTAALDGQALATGVVELPKIEFSFEETLNDTLKALGMTRAFADEAQFSELSDSRVSLSKVLQKAFIGVNEDGARAAAATSVGMAGSSIPQVAFRMQVNRPYLFAIRENTTKAILFLGSINEPEGGKLPPKPQQEN